MEFKTIIEAHDRLSEELSDVLGGKMPIAIICDTGAICEQGIAEPVVIEDQSKPTPPSSNPNFIRI